MPEPTVAEPPTQEPIPNPVLKSIDVAKAAFREQMEIEVPTKPVPEPESIEPPPIPPKEAPPAAEPADEPSKSVLPDDVLNPKEKEPDKPSIIDEIKSAELPKGAKQTTIDSFNKLKTKSIEEITAADARVKELESRIAASTSNAEIEKLNERLKAAEQKASELEDGWAKTSLETSPQFQRKFVKREQQAIEAAKGYLEGTEIDPRVIDYAARNAGSSRLKILEDAGLDAKQIGAVESRLALYDSIQRDKSEAIDHWREQGAQWQEAEQQRTQAEQAKRTEFENKVWDKVLSKNANLLPFRSSKDETWNSQAEAYKLEAREIFLGKGADPETMADVVQRGVVAKSGFYDKIIDHLTKENKLKDERISKLESAAPGGAISQTPEGAPSNDISKMSRDDLSKNTFNQELAKARG